MKQQKKETNKMITEKITKWAAGIAVVAVALLYLSQNEFTGAVIGNITESSSGSLPLILVVLAVVAIVGFVLYKRK